MIKMTPENWKQSNKRYEVLHSLYEEYKTIAGYNCQKALGKLTDGTTFTVYFTKELVPMNKDFSIPQQEPSGLAMQ